MPTGPSKRIEIELLAQDFATDVLKKFGDSAAREGKRAERGLLTADKAAKALKVTLLAAAGAATAFYAAYRLGEGVARRAGDLVKAASDFEEGISKFAVVFGDRAEEAATSVDRLASALGRGRAELSDSSASFQSLFTALGIGRDEAAGLSTDLAQLTVDLGSFFNVADREAQTRLFSGLVGETEAVRRFGVDLQEVSVQNEVLRLGLSKTTNEISQQDKVLARLSLIYKSTKDAQGDAERTASSFQNTIKRLQGGVSDLSIAFGSELRDEILGAIQRLGGIEGVLDLVEVGFGAVTGAGKALIGVAGELATGAQKLIENLGGADVVASALAGNIDGVGFASAEAADAIRFLGSVSRPVFEGIADSAIETGRKIREGLAGGLFDDFKSDVLEAKIRTALDSVRQLSAELKEFRSGNQGAIASLLGRDEDGIKRDLAAAQQAVRDLAAERRAANTEAEKDGEGYAAIWDKVYDQVGKAAADFAERTRANLRDSTDVQDYGLNLVDRVLELRQQFATAGDDAGKAFADRANEALAQAIRGDTVERIVGPIRSAFERVFDAGKKYAEVADLVDRYADQVGDSFDRQAAAADRGADAALRKAAALRALGVDTDDLRDRIEETRRALLLDIETRAASQRAVDEQREAMERLQQTIEGDSIFEGARARLTQFNEEALRGGRIGADLADTFLGGFDSLARTLLDSEASFSEWRDALLADLATVLLRTALLKATFAALKAAGVTLELDGGDKLLAGSGALTLAAGATELAGDKLIAGATALTAAAGALAAVSFAAPFAKGGIMPGVVKQRIPIRSFAEGGIMPGVRKAAVDLAAAMRPANPLPVNTYAGGGIADTPQLAIFGEGRGAEAYVPLGSDRKIPVKFPQLGAQGSSLDGGGAAGGGGGVAMHVTINAQSLDPRGSVAAIRKAMPTIADEFSRLVFEGRPGSTAVSSAIRHATRSGGGR